MSEPWYTKAFGFHYPLMYAHRDEQEAVRCLNLLPQLVPLATDGPLLDLGCGDGRHLQLLAAGGHQAIGLDLSAELLAAARNRDTGRNFPLLRGDMRCLPLSGGSLAGVLSLFTAFGYFGPLDANLGVIQEVARVLRPSGHWYLDYVDCDGVWKELSGGETLGRQRNLGPLSVGESRQLTEDGKQVEKAVVLTSLVGHEEEAQRLGVGPAGVRYTESVALFSVGEMEYLARSAGLTLVATAGSYEGDSLGQGSRWIMVFRKDQSRGGHGGMR